MFSNQLYLREINHRNLKKTIILLFIFLAHFGFGQDTLKNYSSTTRIPTKNPNFINCHDSISHVIDLASTNVKTNRVFAGVVIPDPLYPAKGNLSLGLRSTMSLFGSDNSKFGSGVGGQFRLMLGQRLNTEWFVDYITSNISNVGRRVDGHVGWSVMFYPFNSYRWRPYVLGGHCFDYTKIEAFSTNFTNHSSQSAHRWSSAVQMGLGTHLMITQRCDLSFTGQYMLHIGKDIHAEIVNELGTESLKIESHDEVGLEGHLLLIMSINYAIADLW